jgi:hypothetical protein
MSMIKVNVFREYKDTVLSVGLSHLPGNQGEHDSSISM